MERWAWRLDGGSVASGRGGVCRAPRSSGCGWCRCRCRRRCRAPSRRSCARRGRCSASSARAAAWANGPPEPMAIRSCSGSITSPLPEIDERVRRRRRRSSSASRRRRLRSVRQSLASSIAARVRLPYCCELALEALEQREGVGGAAGEAGEHLALRAGAAPCGRCPSSRCCRASPGRRRPWRRGRRAGRRGWWCRGDRTGLAQSGRRSCGELQAGWLSEARMDRAVPSPPAACARPRVGCVVYPGKVLEIKVRVDLGRADVGVPEQFLHGRAGRSTDSSRCEANEWRNMCGCTCSGSPCRRAHWAIRRCTMRGPRRRPFTPTNTASSPTPAMVARSASQR